MLCHSGFDLSILKHVKHKTKPQVNLKPKGFSACCTKSAWYVSGLSGWSISLVLLCSLIVLCFVFACLCLFASGLEGREISPLCPGASTLRQWKMLRWKMKMAKIYPFRLLCNFRVIVQPELFILECGYHFIWRYSKTSCHQSFDEHNLHCSETLTQMTCLFPWQQCTLSEFTAAVPTALCCCYFMVEVTLHCRGQCSRWAWDHYRASAH